MSPNSPFHNGMQQEMMQGMQHAARQSAFLVFALFMASFLLAVFAAIWMYRDASNRGKHSLAAGAIGLLSFFYGPISTIMICCAWTLFRPELVSRSSLEDSLPPQLPPDIQAGPTADEYFRDLESS